ncbi:alpha/beta fold hydrolase [Lampropedia puyangensis]|uniref:alpha/beta fold hydrolase n=1 Tax=Lampropedia puyangensis TaxID=1330072 RepID=UPI001FCE804E|nr:alpha/beta fold hydrolase [Lampropedia puyangensis]
MSDSDVGGDQAAAVAQARQTIAALDAQAYRHDVPLAGADPAAFVRWRRWGQGAPVVLIHGGHGSWQHWIKNIEALAQDRSVWVPDMPGYGDSSPAAANPQEELAYCRAIVAGLLQTMDAVLPHGSVDVVGFSFGGLVAGLLTAQCPRVRSLALLGPSGHAGPRQQIKDLVRWRGLQGQALADAMRNNLAATMLHQPEAIDAMAVQVHTHSSLQARYRSRTVSRTGVLVDALSTLAQPMLFVWGEHDVTAIPAVAAAALVQGQAQRRAHVWPNVGHWVQYEAAEPINQQLRKWLSQPA